MSLTTPLILYKRALLIPNPDIIYLSFLGVLPVDLYYTSSIVYTPSNYIIAMLGIYSISKGRGIKGL